MGSQRYTEEELRRILEEDDDDDFSDGSDELFVPQDDDFEEDGSESSEGNQEIDSIDSRSSTHELSPVREVSHEMLEGNLVDMDYERESLENENNDNGDDTQWSETILPIGREQFIGNSGLQNFDAVTNEEGSVNIIKVMEYFVNNDILDYMVEKTNAYAHLLKRAQTKRFSRISRWINVDQQEMKLFFGIILYMGIDKNHL